MSFLRRLCAALLADLLALRVMRAHVAAPDPSVPPADRPGDHWSRRIMADAGISPAELRWAAALARVGRLPNREEYDGMAAYALIAATSATGRCLPCVEESRRP